VTVDDLSDEDEASIDDAVFREIVDEAKRAPSKLNAQPARWRLTHGCVLELLEAPERRLFASDPSGRAHRIALGCAWEGTRIALQRRGYRIVDEMGAFVADEGVVVRGRVVGKPRTSTATPLAQTAIAPSASASAVIATGALATEVSDVREVRDPLADAVFVRATWRSRMAPVENDVVLATLGRRVARLGCTMTTKRDCISLAASRIDRATVAGLLQPRRLEENRDWHRFAHDDPRWAQDGVNREALAIGALAGVARSALFHRPAFTAFARAGLAGALMSEASATRSASALVAVTAPSDEPEVVVGARFYRAWLTATSLGLVVCPMSALTDDDDARAALTTALALPEERALVSLWRVGRARGPLPPPSPRLETDELIAS
jgi:nitroreductase